jgi:hypothetical protein
MAGPRWFGTSPLLELPPLSAALLLLGMVLAVAAK